MTPIIVLFYFVHKFYTSKEKKNFSYIYSRLVGVSFLTAITIMIVSIWAEQKGCSLQETCFFVILAIFMVLSIYFALICLVSIKLAKDIVKSYKEPANAMRNFFREVKIFIVVLIAIMVILAVIGIMSLYQN